MNVELLLRRAGFGPMPEDRPGNRSSQSVLEELLSQLSHDSHAAAFDPFEDGAAERAWLRRMLSGRGRLAEKLALFWHGHFATSNRKVGNMALMWRQYELFRRNAAGPFERLVLEVSRDPAMLLWLDGNANRKSCPNENYARELMELFTLGPGHYTENDVREVARSFTGWSCQRGEFLFEAEHHDRGIKQVLGRSGAFTGENVVRLLCSTPACARHVSQKLAEFFVAPDPEEAAITRAAEVFSKSGGRIDRVVEFLLLEGPLRPHIKSPVEFLIGGLIQAGAREVPAWAPEALRRMGQALFYPPSVKGWPGGTAWLGAATLVERFHVADRLGLPQLAAPEFQLN
ncbi:MAG: DUF1800 domain-containing protein [Armatimonadetes bacterium]|nr:DUF1800 domain-containing protein [Armatimonadota bacterium]